MFTLSALTLYQLLVIADPRDPCAEIETAYTQLEKAREGDARQTSAKRLLELARECESNSDMGYETLLAYHASFTAIAGDSGIVSREFCAPLSGARAHAERMVEKQPRVDEFKTFHRSLTSIFTASECDKPSEPVETEQQEGPEIPGPRVEPEESMPIVEEPATWPRTGLIASGSVAGVSFIGGLAFTAAASSEARSTASEIAAQNDPLAPVSDDLCALGSVAPGYEDDCRTLNGLKIGAIVSWSTLGLAALSTAVFGAFFASGQSRELASRVTPFATYGRGAVKLGAIIRF